MRDQGYPGSYKTVVRWLQAQGLLPRHSVEYMLDEESAQESQADLRESISLLELPSPPSEPVKQVTLSDD